MNKSDYRSRRTFLKKAGGISIGMAGAALFPGCNNSDHKIESGNNGKLFLGKPGSADDRIERVKTAALGMQRYDWEQGTMGQALMEMGELDLAISFARGAILRQEKGRFSVLKGNGPITDCSSIGEVVLFAGIQTGDPIYRKGADEMLDVFKKSGHKTPVCRVIKMLPDTMPDEKKKLIGYTKDLIDGCLKYMNPDGTFHDVLNKPETFIEVNLSQMLAYSIFRGTKAGFIGSEYIEKAELMRKAANDRVDEFGYIHDVCGCPSFDRSYYSPEAQAFYLLMEAAAKDCYS